MTTVSSQTDCRTEDGITVGLIDAIITASRVLVGRKLAGHAIEEALKDLRSDSDVLRVVRGKVKHKSYSEDNDATHRDQHGSNGR